MTHTLDDVRILTDFATTAVLYFSRLDEWRIELRRGSEFPPVDQARLDRMTRLVGEAEANLRDMLGLPGGAK